MSGSADTSTSAPDPPLYLGGRHFVTSSASVSTRADSLRNDNSLSPEPTGQMESESAPCTSEPAPLDSPNTMAATQRPDEDAAPVAEQSASSEFDETLIPSEEDDRTRAAVAALQEQARMMHRDGEEIRWLELTSNQLKEMIDEAEAGDRIEYFNVQYFGDEAKKVWRDRQMEDASPESKKTVKLFGNQESAILAQAKRVEAARSAKDEPKAFAMAHPLLHRRAARNEERRAAFRAAAIERKLASELPSAKTCADSSVQSSVYTPQRDLFPRHEWYRLNTSADNSAVQRSANDSRPVVPVERSMQSNPDEPRSLAQMLQDQKVSLEKMRNHDETVYKPVLDAFEQYDKAVIDKMGRLLDMCRTDPAPTDAPAADDSTNA